MDRERIKQITRMLRTSAAAELMVREGDCMVRVSRSRSVERAAPTEAPVSGPAASVAVGVADSRPELVNVSSRLVGFFYRGRGPEQPPLLEVGARVKEGQTVAFIEALRKLTEVVSPVTGEVAEVVAGSGQAVQFGDVLLRILPEQGHKPSK